MEMEVSLRKWLAEPPVKSLRKIAEGLENYSLALALRDALQSGPVNEKLTSANLHLVEAQRYRTFIDLLDHFRDPRTELTLTKLI
jgi:hypothetical protein